MHRPIENLPTEIPKSAWFGATRRFDIHTGIDLHTPEGTIVYAMEDGEVKAVGPFTGEAAGCDWWLATDFVGVWGASGYIVYGEIESLVNVGDLVKEGQPIAKVKRVLKNDKGLPTSMLHLERYTEIVTEHASWEYGEEKPEFLVDPSSILIEAGLNTSALEKKIEPCIGFCWG
jgi:hypothetical protein